MIRQVSVFVVLYIQFANVFSVLIDCHPDKNASKTVCKSRGCVWSPHSEPRVPWCTFCDEDAKKWAGYDVQQKTFIKQKQDYESIVGTLERRPTPTLFGNDVEHLFFHIQPLTDKILRVFISDIDQQIQRVPHEYANQFLRTHGEKKKHKPSYSVQIDESPFGFAVTRKMTGTIIVDTRKVPGFTFSEQFLQISIKLPSGADVFGIGENSHEQLKHDFQWRKWGLFTKDTRPGYSAVNLYGMHPFYLCMEDDHGNSHGFFLLNSHAMEVVLQPDPKIISFKPIGGVLEMFIFLGPSPDEVVEQYTSIIGRSLMPPYWAMGFNLCRWGYKNVTYLRQVFDRNRVASIPQDVQFIDLDYMDNRMDFTVDEINFRNLTTFVRDVHEKYKMKLVVIVDPAIANKPNKTYEPLDLGLKMNVFVKDSRTGQPLEGVAWPGTSHWVDFTHPSSAAYWTYCHLKFHNIIDYDGIWIDMNEPSNFGNGSTTGCGTNKYNYPPFNPLIYENFTDMTLCMDGDQYMGKQYSLHSLYAYTEAKATYNALQTVFPGKRPFVLSRSTFAGSGHYTNHWMGDNESKWSHMRLSIINLLEYQMFGFSLMGADICGFGYEATEELCLRWMQLGSFYPYMRNHNDISSKVDQDPAAWPKNTTEAMRKTLLIRYMFLPYLYTLIHNAHVNGTPVARPLFFEYLTDAKARLVNDQFLWGSGLMVIPILEPYSTTRFAYFPSGRWYNLSTQMEVPGPTASRNLSIFIAKDAIGLFVRGGSILAVQDPGVTTFESRRNNFGLLVGLDENGRACGSLYLDDGETETVGEAFSHLRFYAYNKPHKNQGGINLSCIKNGFIIEPPLAKVEFFGLIGNPVYIKIDGKPASSSQLVVDLVKHKLTIHNISLDLNQDHQITWKNS